MAKQTFAATVAGWCDRVPEALLALFRECASDLVQELTDELSSRVYETPESPNYKRTQFLLASLLASTTEMPKANRDNPGGPVTVSFDQVEFVINNAELGETLYLGYSSSYGPYVHSGTSRMPPRPWVDAVAQRWDSIVQRRAADVGKRFGLL